MNEPRGQELITRYKSNYGIPIEAPVSEAMILHHWKLEKELTQKLLQSAPENRFQTFEECYSQLYAELKWLNEYIDKNISHPSLEKELQPWLTLIGTPNTQKIYEIGSGKATLISFLARHGYPCTATEITRERGEKFATDTITWRTSDGVHLDRFEHSGAYDVVISDQVIEHIHPDDTQEHFRGVHNILKQNGKYIFRAPHRLDGPHDISHVFKCDTAQGMHLREMTFDEVRDLARNAGFSRIELVVLDSRIAKNPLFSKDGKVSTPLYFSIVIMLEGIIKWIPKAGIRKKAIRMAARLGFFPSCFAVATK